MNQIICREGEDAIRRSGVLAIPYRECCPITAAMPVEQANLLPSLTLCRRPLVDALEIVRQVNRRNSFAADRSKKDKWFTSTALARRYGPVPPELSPVSAALEAPKEPHAPSKLLTPDAAGADEAEEVAVFDFPEPPLLLLVPSGTPNNWIATTLIVTAFHKSPVQGHGCGGSYSILERTASEMAGN